MLKKISATSPELTAFVEKLQLPLSEAQQDHVKQITDALITVEGDKNLSNLYRHIVGDPCPKSAADTFREAPWKADDIRVPLRTHLVKTAFALAEAQGAPKVIFLSIDDSFTEKDRHSQRLESVDWHYDRERSRPKEPVYTKGTVYVLMRLTIGNISLTIDIQQYLRKKTTRRLNRRRKRGQRLSFRSKLVIARHMLQAIQPLIPQDYQVYILFDSWYASAKFINWCRKQKWHVMCRLKSNRQVDSVPVKRHHQRLSKKRYTVVRLHAADEEKVTTYQVRSLTGQLNDVDQTIRVFISKRRKRDKHPRYYGVTDTELGPQKALTFFQNRWSCEVANWYIVERLGWADCRLWRFESSDKFLMVLWLALAYLEMHHAKSEQFENLAAVIRQHQQAHAQRTLVEACQLALQVGDLSQVLARFTIAA